ncbi:hypothetical protein FB548_0899 [Pseudoxanthomonas sp. 3HH-4]|uniref:hypothetical protein n=1 Tax=Pseudoxanthomonas sp. 3HH-4 TaxID=1690214 RepID=UPI0011534EDA|nr:hypothetical protein [Pseudoxanthomonas sp. 3HH-4]TQM17514.1 hypothetical protein FB548_0899 [Pseudoxanthomonas sp. 3HH-4]
MPDVRTRDAVPRDWGDAFAGLPLEAAPADSWAMLAARLPRPVVVQPHRWPRRAAMAAALALAVVLPLRWTNPTTPSPARPTTSTHQPAPPADKDSPPLYAEAAKGLPIPIGTRATDAATTSSKLQRGTLPVARQRAARPTGDVDPAKAAAPPATDPLDALYAESAQLEAVLARLPESRMANAATEALSAGLQERVASIDMALSQAALPNDAQAQLWQARVDTLRQLTGVETTQRWQVARGEPYPHPDTAIY